MKFINVLLAMQILLISGCVTGEKSVSPNLGADQVIKAGAVVPSQEPLTVDEAIKQNKLAAVVLAGQVEKVCQKKGCWMTIKTEQEDLRVTFKDYGFFVPLGAGGKKVKMVGELAKKEISVADQRHFLEDEKRPQEDIEAITKPKVTYTFVASGVEIYP